MCNDFEQHIAWAEYCELMQYLVTTRRSMLRSLDLAELPSDTVEVVISHVRYAICALQYFGAIAMIHLSAIYSSQMRCRR